MGWITSRHLEESPVNIDGPSMLFHIIILNVYVGPAFPNQVQLPPCMRIESSSHFNPIRRNVLMTNGSEIAHGVPFPTFLRAAIVHDAPLDGAIYILPDKNTAALSFFPMTRDKSPALRIKHRLAGYEFRMSWRHRIRHATVAEVCRVMATPPRRCF
jgi:hypothetical protein